MLHSGRVEGRPPAALVVLGELQVEALAVHARGDVAGAGLGVKPAAQRVQHAFIREHRAPGEAERRHEEAAASPTTRSLVRLTRTSAPVRMLGARRGFC